jgi:cytidylate kinase
MRTNLVVAIDGYSSCGKSTIAKALAKKLGFIYVDSGAMYRAVTLYFLRNQVDVHQEEAVAAALAQIELNFHARDYQTHITLNGEEVSEEIRQMPVANFVSTVASLKQVRVEMVRQQQQMAAVKNIVMDGRDIGTAVFPDAPVKLFMTADPMVRAQRRFDELRSKGDQQVSLEEVYESLKQRDYADTTRAESPLIQAADAVVLDNTNLSPDEQLEFAFQLIRSKQPVTAEATTTY